MKNVTAEAPGFNRSSQTGIELSVNDRRNVNFVLQVRGQSEEIKVEAEPLQVDLQSATAAGLISGNQNSRTLDGADNVDRGGNQVLLTFPSIDSIAEFKVLRGNYDAEFGRGSGGQLNVVTRSGTNTYHGSAYEFFRNDVLAANNFFNNLRELALPPLRYNNFGFTIGGSVFIQDLFEKGILQQQKQAAGVPRARSSAKAPNLNE